jgi:TM2 domain-containing membrane protein YozV
MAQSVPPPSAPPAVHAVPTDTCEACGQAVDFRAHSCPRCDFPLRPGASHGGPVRSSKKPRTAMWLSLGWPGAGHFYAGDSEKGLIFSGASVVVTVLSFTVLGAVLGMLIWLGLALYTAIDSNRAIVAG